MILLLGDFFFFLPLFSLLTLAMRRAGMAQGHVCVVV